MSERIRNSKKGLLAGVASAMLLSACSQNIAPPEKLSGTVSSADVYVALDEAAGIVCGLTIKGMADKHQPDFIFKATDSYSMALGGQLPAGQKSIRLSNKFVTDEAVLNADGSCQGPTGVYISDHLTKQFRSKQADIEFEQVVPEFESGIKVWHVSYNQIDMDHSGDFGDSGEVFVAPNAQMKSADVGRAQYIADDLIDLASNVTG